MLYAVLSLAFAEDGVLCVATWPGAVSGCGLDAGPQATAAGPTEGVATRLAREKLARVLELSAQERAVRPRLDAAAYAFCPQAADELAVVRCTAGPPSDTAACVVRFDDPHCWDGDVLSLETGGWRAFVQGRVAMCQEVDEALLMDNADADDRARCQASCALRTHVACTEQ